MAKLKKLSIQGIALLCGELIILALGGVMALKAKLIPMTEGYRKSLLLYVYEKKLHKSGSWIGYRANLRSEPVFPHGIQGIFISNGADIGEGCVIFQQVTIGSNTIEGHRYFGSPIIGEGCYIGAGAKIIGHVRLGNNVRVGANCVVVKDVPDNCVVVAQSPRIIQKENLDNDYREYTKE
jgi:serine O-acetyltransferase